MDEWQELATWLRGVLDEVKRAAIASCDQQRPILERMHGGDQPGVWRAHIDCQPGCPPEPCVFSDDGDGGLVASPTEDDNLATARHIALHDPRSVLARIEAELAMLDELELAVRDVRVTDLQDRSLVDASAERRDDARTLLRWMVYGHRFNADGWRAEWAPDAVRAEA